MVLDARGDLGDVVREEGGGGEATRAVLRGVAAALGTGLLGEGGEVGHGVGVERAGGLGEQQVDAAAVALGVGVVAVAAGDVAVPGEANVPPVLACGLLVCGRCDA